MNRTVTLARLAPFAIVVAAGAVLGRFVLLVNNPWSIVLAGVAVAIGVAVFSSSGFRGLLVMHAWLLWYPLFVQPLAAAGGPLTKGATLAELVFVAAGAFWAMQTLLGRRKTAAGSLPVVCALVASLGWLFTVIVAPASLTFPTFRHVLYLVLLSGLCAEHVRSPAEAWPLVWGVVVSTLVQSGVVFWGQHIGGLPFYDPGAGVLLQDTTRLHGLYTLPGAVPVEVWGSRQSGLMAAASLVLLLRAAYGPEGRGRRVASVLVIISGGLLLSTGGRAGWVGFLLGLGAVILVSLRNDDLSARRAAARIAVLVGLAGASYAGAGLLGVVWQRASTLTAVAQDSSWITRVRFLQLGLAQLAAHPLGIGFDTLLRTYGVFEHNTYLVLANGVGPIGLGAFCVLWVWIGHRSMRLIRGDSRQKALLGMLSLAVLIAVLVAGTAENTPFLSEGPWVVWGVALGMGNDPPPLGKLPS